MTETYTLSTIEDVAEQLLKSFQRNTILFEAEMGSGKTTLIKALAKKLGVRDATGSPTFGLVNEYKGKTTTIYHFDLYRIEDSDELFDIGFEDYLDEDAYIFIEWPQHARVFLDDGYHTLNLEVVNSKTRTLTLR